MKTYKQKRLVAGLLLTMVMVFPGCSQKDASKTESESINQLETVQEEIKETMLVERSEDVPFQNARRLIQSEIMRTSFFTLQINEIQVTDELAEYTAKEGTTFLILTLHLENVSDRNHEIMSGNVPMYASDFAVYWGKQMENREYPSITGIMEELPLEYELVDVYEGKMVFLIPDDIKECALVYEEYYSYGEGMESHLMDSWVMEMDLQNWTRDAQ